MTSARSRADPPAQERGSGRLDGPAAHERTRALRQQVSISSLEESNLAEIITVPRLESESESDTVLELNRE